MKETQLVVGILAHVDAGKTTLSEGLLYQCGQIRQLGRVDHQTAFLDTDHQERERGITIFSKQAILPLEDRTITLLDTPGHVDFSSEMERTLQVLDYAILVISGTDGIQSHTMTLWKLLSDYQIPTFLFINKMDLSGADRPQLLTQLQKRLSAGCLDFGCFDASLEEQIAVTDDGVLEHYLEHGVLEQQEIISLIQHRKVFPCWFGSALKLDGVSEFLSGFQRYTCAPPYSDQFGAKVFKIARDSQGNRLTYLKVTGGTLRVKAAITNQRSDHPLPDAQIWTEKADQLRVYSGSQFHIVDTVAVGGVCAVTGLSKTYPGQGLGFEEDAQVPVLEPVLSFQVLLPDHANTHTVLKQLQQLEEEDPQLHIVWNEGLREIHIQLMGQVQLEVLQNVIAERFGLELSFGTGSILYRETIAEPVEGIGHFEPLRHYAEVHLLLEPLERGSGLQFDSICSEDVLDRNWQRLILTHLMEKIQPGVLTGSPITDLKISLVTGRAHVKHTEGGDFRQATYRAVRQGLMCAKSVLLEPWYQIRLEVPSEQVGRAMSDIQRMGGTFSLSEELSGTSVLNGELPVATLGNYAADVASYTRGQGRLFCSPAGYRPCHNPEEVIAQIGYNSERDTEHPADSVFCDHGAGFVVKWNEVRNYMHVDSGLQLHPSQDVPTTSHPPSQKGSVLSGSIEADEELRAIFERTYGPIRRRDLQPQPKPRKRPSLPETQYIKEKQELGLDYLLVDGYNIIFAWEDLKELAQDNLDAARQKLMDMMCNYQGYRNCQVIIVFDAYKVPRGCGEVTHYHNIHVVYTKEAETADAYIEKATYELSKQHHRVRVATSDYAEQLIILGHGALRLSATTFRKELDQTCQSLTKQIAQHNRSTPSQPIRIAMELAKKKS